MEYAKKINSKLKSHTCASIGTKTVEYLVLTLRNATLQNLFMELEHTNTHIPVIITIHLLKKETFKRNVVKNLEANYA
jgi:hypothetical protein